MVNRATKPRLGAHRPGGFTGTVAFGFGRTAELATRCALRSDSRSESEHEARCARRHSPLRCSASQRRPQSGAPSRTALQKRCWRTNGGAPAPGFAAGGARWGRSLRRRGAQIRGWRALARFVTDSPRLFERSTQSARSEFCGATLNRAPQRSLRKAQTAEVARENRATKNRAQRESLNMDRRTFFAGAATAVSSVAMAALPEPVIATRPDTAPPLVPNTGRPYNPVVTLNGWTLPWRMNNGVKEFHLVAEPVVREMAPGFKVNMWGYNGQSPGPTIEVVEGDRVRIFVTNKLPEHTTIHWHGQRLPNGMDGVGGLTQKQIPVGKTFVYEFVARRPGTFMYHPHADEMTQMAMGMMGLWVTHPRAKHPLIDEVQRDFCFLLNAFDVNP
eukprot:gene41964-52016_t